MNFVPTGANFFVNLEHVVTIQVGQAKSQVDPDKTDTVVILNTVEKHAIICRGVFAQFVLKVIGAEAHITGA